METRSQEPLKPHGPMREPAGQRWGNRFRTSGPPHAREAGRALNPELEIVLGQGVPWGRLKSAIDAAPADVAPLHALLAEGVVDEERFYQALADRLGCAYYVGEPPFARDFDVAKALQCGVAPLAAAAGEAHAVIAPRAAVASRLIDMIQSGRLRPESFAVTSPQRFSAMIRAQRPREFLDHALAGLPEALSAKRGPTGAQIVVLGLVAATAAALAAASPQLLSGIASAALWAMFAASIGVRSLAAVANAVDERQPRLLADDELPTYTIVAPAYREEDVVAQLVRALDALDYPKSKLDIKLVVERRDPDTLARLLALNLPARYQIVIAPPGEPTTKPRALDIALLEARGALLVVYDAEDIPARGQLRQAASRFAADPSLDCLQARLTVRNVADSWLSSLFSVEYAALFDLINPGLCALGLPIALGGTSNHFRVSALLDAGAWDAWNVAEDADLGIRLARFGFKVGALASDTSEEAPHEFANWFRQRVRWQKGWMQTCVVHAREPVRFVREMGALRAFAAAVLIFGAVFGALTWPAFAVSTLWRAFGSGAGDITRWREAGDLFVYILSAAGIWSVVIPAVVAARQRGLNVAAGTFALLPLYYALVSLAAWTAIADLVIRPHFWAKTEHGRARPRPLTRAIPSRAARD